MSGGKNLDLQRDVVIDVSTTAAIQPSHPSYGYEMETHTSSSSSKSSPADLSLPRKEDIKLEVGYWINQQLNVDVKRYQISFLLQELPND